MGARVVAADVVLNALVSFSSLVPANPLVACLLVSFPPKPFGVLPPKGAAYDVCGFWKAFEKVAPDRFESLLSSNALFLFCVFAAGIAKGEGARFDCCAGCPKARAGALFVLFGGDANGLDEAAEPKGFDGIGEDELGLANGLLAAVVVCDCGPKGFEATLVAAARAAANGLLMAASLFDVLNPPEGPPLFDDVELRALVAFEEPKFEKLGSGEG